MIDDGYRRACCWIDTPRMDAIPCGAAVCVKRGVRGVYCPKHADAALAGGVVRQPTPIYLLHLYDASIVKDKLSKPNRARMRKDAASALGLFEVPDYNDKED